MKNLLKQIVRCLNKSEQGFSLVELLLYLGLFSLLLMLITNVFLSSLDVQLESRSSSSVEQDGRYIITRLSYDIEHAQSITQPAARGSQTANLQLVVNSINYSYAIASGVLQFNAGGQVDSLSSYATTISNITFTRLGSGLGKDTIAISFTLTSNTKRTGITEARSYTTTVGLR